jgi:N-acetylmuramoyl-L-alanine amidase
VFRADAYIGLEASEVAGVVVRYYQVPNFVSVGGKTLATRVVDSLREVFPGLPCSVDGVRHPVLRETRMPAVLCSLGPTQMMVSESLRVAEAVADAWNTWWAEPAASA